MAEKIAIPESTAELEELMNDQGKVGELIAAGQFPDVIKAYAKATDDRGTIAEQVKEQVMATMAGQEQIAETITNEVKSGIETFLTEHGVPKRPQLAAPEGGPSGAEANAAYNALAPGVKMNDLGFVNLGDYARTIWHKNPMPDARRDKALEVMNAYSTIDPALGGFLIPEITRSEVMQIALEDRLCGS